MSWILNAIYSCFLILGSPWLLWRAISQGKNRRGWGQKLFGMPGKNSVGQKLVQSTGECIWFHAVSVGEVNLLAPVLQRLTEAQPDLRIAISTTTETGFDLACKKFSQHEIFFCPMDFTWAIKRVLKRLRPRMLVLAELELWPNLIQTTRAAGVPVAVINGRLSQSSHRGYQKFGWLLKPVFANLSFVAAQNQTYADRFKSLGCEPANVVVTGSVKFDGIETDRANSKTNHLKRLAGISASDQVFVAGSTQVEEDVLAASVYQTVCCENSNVRLILVPRHPERVGALVGQLDQMGIPTVLRSSLSSSSSSTKNGQTENENLDAKSSVDSQTEIRPVLIVDVIGELGAWWGCADAAYVGGSMGKRGGQNMIEPAGYGIPVSFGPNTENFRDIVDQLLASEAATVVENESDLLDFVTNTFNGDVESGARAQNVVLTHVGASQRTIEALCLILGRSIETSRLQVGREPKSNAA